MYFSKAKDFAGFPGLRLLKLRVIANRLHHLTDCIYDNVGSINNDEMRAPLRDPLLAVFEMIGLRNTASLMNLRKLPLQCLPCRVGDRPSE